jgi:hypothetical protein
VKPAADGLALLLPATNGSVTIEVPWPVRAVTLDGAAPNVTRSERTVTVPSGPAGRDLRIERA